jgi:peptide-methionine (S)-S-oxide reductase
LESHFCSLGLTTEGNAVDLPQTTSSPAQVATLTLAGGCFWCLEAVYEHVIGVQSVVSGYANGAVDFPSYEAVCSGNTGHAEAVQIRFDPGVVSPRDLLEVFFVIHDPTTLNRQGHDVGTQYRSGIYYVDETQLQLAREVIGDVQAGHAQAVVTEVEPLRCFWPAEAYHQHYFAQHPGQGYCAFVVAPKVEKFRQTFARLLRHD